MNAPTQRTCAMAVWAIVPNQLIIASIFLEKVVPGLNFSLILLQRFYDFLLL